MPLGRFATALGAWAKTNGGSQRVEESDVPNEKPDKKPKPEKKSPDAITLKAALDGLREQLLALPESELTSHAGLDAADAAGKVIGSLERLRSYRAAIHAEFDDEGTDHLDALEAIAYATRQADIELLAADDGESVSDRFAQLLESHALLETDCDALANRKLLDRARIDAGRSVQGQAATITSTLVLVSLLRESWRTIQHKTPLTEEDLTRIAQEAQDLDALLNQRSEGTHRLEAQALRSRALSELVRHHGEVRRRIQYLRYWHGDTDEIAPSLWAGRRRKNKDAPHDPNEPRVPIPTPGPKDGPGPFITEDPDDPNDPNRGS
jgi:hypothetical protein